MIVDVHTHCLKPEHWGDEYTTNWTSAHGATWPDITPADFDAAMRAGGVGAAVVFGLTATAAGMRTPNRYVADFCAEATTPTVAFMALDPSDSDVMDQIDEGLELGMQGVKLYPILAAFSPIDRALEPFFARLEREGLVVLWHMGGSPSRRSVLRYSHPLLLDELAERHPELRQVIAHLAHPWQRDTMQVIRTNPYLYADISAVWDRPMDGYLAMVNAVEWRATGKLLFGSDYPVVPPAEALERFRAVGRDLAPPLPAIDPEVFESIITRDTCELLGLQPS